MESLIEFYFRLFEYIKANWKKYIELFKKMSIFEKSIQCLLFVIELIIIFYLTVEISNVNVNIKMYKSDKIKMYNYSKLI